VNRKVPDVSDKTTNDPGTDHHFDLGVDHLADDAELTHMDEPWQAGEALPGHGQGVEPMQAPGPQLAPWADGLQLPGV
jgi:hypothetical protein